MGTNLRHPGAEGGELMSHRRIAAVASGPIESADVAAKVGGKHVVISSFDSPVNPHYNGGGAAVVDMIAHRLAQHFVVTVITVAHRHAITVHNGVRYKQLPISWAGPRAGQLLFHMLLPFAVKRIRHDLWIENFTPPFSTSFLPLFSRAPVVGFAQSLSGKNMSDQYRLPFFLVERLGLRFYRDVVVLNAADGVVVRRSSPSATVRVIPNGIKNKALDEKVLGRREHILFLGRIKVMEKGLDLLLEAYEKSGLAMPLFIAGSGTRPEERKFAALLATTGGDVRWVGHVTGQQKQDLLEGSAFVMLPSRHEAFGLAALEGMSYAKPIVHFDVPALRWMDGDVRIPPFDVSALASEMRYLADDEVARQELGRTAHATAQRYSSDDMADRHLSLVQEILGVPGPGTKAKDGPPCL
jgi:glycosyltransferase involved in cell wall biosynthesis